MIIICISFENHWCAVHSWFFLSNVMFMFCFQCFCQSFYASVVVQSSALLHKVFFTHYDPHCLLACLLPHSVLLISPSFHEWVVGEWNPSIMWHSLVCSCPHRSFLTWVVTSSWFFFPKKLRRNQREWVATKFKVVIKYCFKPWSRVGTHCSLH